MAEEPAPHQKRTATRVLERFGHTYAEQAGITLDDKPAPLYQLLVLTTLLSHRISADLAVEAARALFAAGYRTPQRMREATWQERVDALGRGHFRRYDESTATTLGDTAVAILDRWDGDLRKMRDAGDSDPARIHGLLMEFKGIGPTGADIFLREVQDVWPGIAPYVDAKVSDGATLLDLPTDAHQLADLAGSSSQVTVWPPPWSGSRSNLTRPTTSRLTTDSPAQPPMSRSSPELNSSGYPQAAELHLRV